MEGLLCLGFGGVTCLSGWRDCVYYFRQDGDVKTAERFNQSIENIDNTLLPYFEKRPNFSTWGVQISITKNYPLTHAFHTFLLISHHPSIHPGHPHAILLPPRPKPNTCNPTRETPRPPRPQLNAPCRPKSAERRRGMGGCEPMSRPCERDYVRMRVGSGGDSEGGGWGVNG